MRTKWFLVCIVGALALSGRAPARAQDAVALARTYKDGEAVRYKTSINVNVGGMEVIISRTTKHVVKEVKKNGDVVILVNDEGGSVSLGGQDMDQPAGPPMTETRDKLGKLIDLKREDNPLEPFSPEIGKLLATLGDVLFPEKPVRASNSWQTELDNPAVKGKKMTVKSTFVGIDGAEPAAKLWKVKQTVEADTDDKGAKMTQEINAWLKPENGQLVKLEGSAKEVPTLMYGNLSWTMKIETLKDTEKKP